MHTPLTVKRTECPGKPTCYCGETHDISVDRFSLCRVGGITPEDEARAESIVTACNAHEALVSALEAAKYYLDCLDMETADEEVRNVLQQARAALALARKEGER